MIFYKQERLGLFMDGSNLHTAAKVLGYDIDYKKLLGFFSEKGILIRAFYYTALVEEQDYSPIRPLVDWLDYNGYSMVTKPFREYTDSSGRRRVKGNTDIELAVDVMELSDRLDHIVLFSGDGDFRCVVEAAQKKGVRVTVVSTIRTNPPMIADDLRRQADNFIDLKDIGPYIMRDVSQSSSSDSDQPAAELQEDFSLAEKTAVKGRLKSSDAKAA